MTSTFIQGGLQKQSQRGQRESRPLGPRLFGWSQLHGQTAWQEKNYGIPAERWALTPIPWPLALSAAAFSPEEGATYSRSLADDE